MRRVPPRRLLDSLGRHELPVGIAGINLPGECPNIADRLRIRAVAVDDLAVLVARAVDQYRHEADREPRRAAVELRGCDLRLLDADERQLCPLLPAFALGD